MAELAPLTIGPFIGMCDTPNLSAQASNRASYIENMYAPAAYNSDGAMGGDLIGRPGNTRYDFSAYAGTGTISSSANVITGTSTLFTTQVSVGDLITPSNGSPFIMIVISDNVDGQASISPSCTNATFTITPAAIVGGQIFGDWQHTTTVPAYHRFLIVKTTSTLVGGGSVGAYRFLGASSERLRLVEYNPAATAPYQVFTDRTSTTMNSVLLDITTRIYATTFANYFIITDGKNRPRKIDTSALPYVLSNLTDGNYATFGSLQVYYGKLFFIDASDRITERWSEENDPDTGYGTGTSDNSWALRQTSADPLSTNVATNDALYCFRQNSCAIITGAANSDFRSSGTVDAIQNIGTRSPDAAFVINSSVVFIDQYGRPGRIQPGYGYLPLWKRIQETLRMIGLTANQLQAAWGRYDPEKNMIQFGYRNSNSATTNDQMLVIDADSWECLGLHKLYKDSSYGVVDHAYAAVFLDENLKPRMTIASGTTADCAIYVQQTEEVPANSARDVTSGGSVTVRATVISPKFGIDPLSEKTFQRLAVGIRNVGGTTAGVVLWKSQLLTPYDSAYSTAQNMLLAGQATAPAGWTLDGMCYKAEQQGIVGTGRWVQAKFTNDTTGNPATRPTFDTLSVLAVPGTSTFQTP